MCLTAILMVLALCGLFAAVGVRLFTSLAISGRATTAAGLRAIVLLNRITLITVFVLFVLQPRRAAGFLPTRDRRYFVARHGTIHE
jgi:hypothetical protein